MIDKNRLNAEIALNGTTQTKLCGDIGMDQSTFIRKVRDNKFGTDEVERIIDTLPTLKREPIRAFSIFFAKEVT